MKMHPDTGREQVGKCAMGNTHGKGGSTDWVLFRFPWPHYKLLAAWTPWVLSVLFSSSSSWFNQALDIKPLMHSTPPVPQESYLGVLCKPF